MPLSKGRRLDPALDTKTAYARYQEIGNLRQLARETGFSSAALRYRFESAGLPLYKRGEWLGKKTGKHPGKPLIEIDIDAAYADYLKAGFTPVSEKYGVSTHTLARRFKAAGLKIFKPGRRIQGDAPLSPKERQERYKAKRTSTTQPDKL